MKKNILSIAVVGLLLAGCSSPGGTSSSLVGGMKLWPGRGGSETSGKAFAEAVENDPFPRADQPVQADLKVAARR